MTGRKLACIGGATTALAAICCFTPLLVIVLPALGLAGWLAWLDYVLLPLLLVGLAATAIGVWRLRRSA